jgi:hypothetical protein
MKRLAVHLNLFSGKQGAHQFQRLAHDTQGSVGSEANGLEVSGRTDTETQCNASRKELVERSRRHRRLHRVHREGAHSHQRDTHALRLRERHRRQGDRVTLEEVIRNPYSGGAAALSSGYFVIEAG